VHPIHLELWSVTRRVREAVWPGYVVAILGPVISTLIREGLGDTLIGYPFITFFPAVLATSLVGDRKAAALSIVASAMLALQYAVDAQDSWLPQSTSAWIGISFFLIVCALLAALVQWLFEALDRLSTATFDLESLNAGLEQRIAVRTQELALANAQLRAEAKAREAAEAQFRQAQKMQAVGQLTGGIAHDFNNMLAIIISGLDLAKRRMAKGDKDVVKYIDGALDGARRGATLTQRLLAFSRQTPLSPAIIDTNQRIRSMEELLRRTLGETIDLEFVLGGGLWATNVDPGQLENALLNVVVNARDAMPNGGRLTVETMNGHLDDDYAAQHNEVTAGQYVMLAITDTGDGMSPEISERAFDPFFTTKAIGKGTGLGLSQVYGFVKQSGGHVKIYSEPGHGTTVKIYLRRAVAEPMQGTQQVRQEPLPTGSTEEIVLVVEDETGVRKLTVDALRELGYTVRHAASGPEALQLLERMGSLSLLFTDVVMPGMSGRQLADAARQKRPDIRILYTTGYTPNAIVHNGVVDKDAELLMKPFTIDQLARKVRKVLAQEGAGPA
jgi:signal transduction histidine kinase/ActR/RegA family two-component response regulator